MTNECIATSGDHMESMATVWKWGSPALLLPSPFSTSGNSCLFWQMLFCLGIVRNLITLNICQELHPQAIVQIMSPCDIVVACKQMWNLQTAGGC